MLGHFYRFKFKGKRGAQPYEFLERTERTVQREPDYRFKQAGTGELWTAVAEQVTRYLVCEEPPPLCGHRHFSVRAAERCAENQRKVGQVRKNITGPVKPAKTGIVTKEERDTNSRRYLVKRLKSVSIALQQVVDDKAKWSKYAEEYAEVVSGAKKIADLIKLGVTKSAENDSLSHSTTHPTPDYKAEYERLDTEIHALGKVVIHTLDQMVPLLAEMQQLLSRKASTRTAKDGLPMWGDYLDGIAEEFGISKRTIQRRLHDLNHPEAGYEAEEPEEGEAEAGEAEDSDEQDDAKGGKGKRQEMVPVIEEPLASQLCKEGAHLARLVKSLLVSRETLIKRADMYLEKLHGNAMESESALPELAPEPPKTSSWEDDDAEEAKRRELYPLTSLADYLLRIADELGCAWGLNGFCEEIQAIGEKLLDREVLNERMLKLEERAAKLPEGVGISGRYLFKELRRDRRYQEDMRNIIKAGGTMYRGQKILGGDDPYIWRFTRDEIKAEMGLGGAKNVVKNRIGVFSITEDDVEDVTNKKPVASDDAEAAEDEETA